MRVAVVGATGLIGRARVRGAGGARRRGRRALAPAAPRASPGSRTCAGTPPRARRRAAALDGADALVNLAGAPLAGRALDARPASARSARAASLTTRALVDALAGDGRPRVLVNASGIDYYGPRGEETVDETAGAGSGFLAETCVAWEREAARAADHGVRVVMVRSAVVLSDEDGALPCHGPARAALRGRPDRRRPPVAAVDPPRRRGGPHPASRSTAPDLAGPLNATSPEPSRQGEFVKALGHALGRPAVVPTPAVALRLALGEMATLVLDGQRAVPRAALAAGYRFRHPDLDGALRAIYG